MPFNSAVIPSTYCSCSFFKWAFLASLAAFSGTRKSMVCSSFGSCGGASVGRGRYDFENVGKTSRKNSTFKLKSETECDRRPQTVNPCAPSYGPETVGGQETLECLPQLHFRKSFLAQARKTQAPRAHHCRTHAAAAGHAEKKGARNELVQVRQASATRAKVCEVTNYKHQSIDAIADRSGGRCKGLAIADRHN